MKKTGTIQVGARLGSKSAKFLEYAQGGFERSLSNIGESKILEGNHFLQLKTSKDAQCWNFPLKSRVLPKKPKGNRVLPSENMEKNI